MIAHGIDDEGSSRHSERDPRQALKEVRAAVNELLDGLDMLRAKIAELEAGSTLSEKGTDDA